ncbi:MAG: LUD domain-containing protein [Chitinophagales bacterium]
MSEEQKKINFFKALKNVMSNSEENASKNKAAQTEDEDNVLRHISLKTVTPTGENQETEKFTGISKATDLDIQFAENFVDSGGKFIFTENEEELIQFLASLKTENNWNNIFSIEQKINRLFQLHAFQNQNFDILLENADAAISMCYSLSATEGVIILSPEEATTRRLVTFPKNHIIIAFKNQLKKDIKEAILGFREQFDDRLPSVLELYNNKPVAKFNHKTLLSADGPENVFLFYIDKDIEQ